MAQQREREREIQMLRERELAASLASQERDIVMPPMGPPPPRPLQARRGALALPAIQQQPVMRPALPAPTGHGRGRVRSAEGGCNVEGCPGAKRARSAGHGHGYSHVLASLLRGEPSTSVREQTGLYGGPEPGTSRETQAPMACSGTHTMIQGVGALITPASASSSQSSARGTAGSGQRPAKRMTLSERLTAATLVALQGVPREPTPPPLQLSPMMPAPSEEEGLAAPSEEALVETPDDGEGESEVEDFPVPTSGKLTKVMLIIMSPFIS